MVNSAKLLIPPNFLGPNGPKGKIWDRLALGLKKNNYHTTAVPKEKLISYAAAEPAASAGYHTDLHTSGYEFSLSF